MSLDVLPPDLPQEPAESPRSSRGKLIEAGTRLFQAQGYRRVSLDRILRESGVCRSNFYYHFRGKQDLAIAVIDEWYDELSAGVFEPALRDPGSPPLVRARAVVDALIERLDAHGCRGGCPFGTLANAEAEHNETIRTRLRDVFEQITSVFERLFGEAVRSGEIGSGAPSPRDLATGTVSLVEGGYLLSKAYTDTSRMRDAARSWFDLVGRSTAR